MKAKIIVLLSVILTAQFASAGSPFYYESISNPSKTIDFIIGFYPTQYSISTASDNKEYISYNAAVINNSKSSLDWSDYYMIIRKKNGDLFFNYLTAATSGEYQNVFIAEPTATHYTKFCYHDIVKPDDIADVYLFDKSKMKSYLLVYNEGK